MAPPCLAVMLLEEALYERADVAVGLLGLCSWRPLVTSTPDLP